MTPRERFVLTVPEAFAGWRPYRRNSILDVEQCQCGPEGLREAGYFLLEDRLLFFTFERMLGGRFIAFNHVNCLIAVIYSLPRFGRRVTRAMHTLYRIR